MLLSEAADLFKRIVEICPGLEGKNFLIMFPEKTSLDIAEGYEVIIRKKRTIVDPKTRQVLRYLAAENHLRILETENSIAIYTPSHALDA